ncbi:MAG: alanine--glyoxylate aminotransferase family protein [Sulfolobaceae archaeon]
MSYTNELRRLLMHVGPVNIDLDVLLSGVKSNVGFTSREFIEASSYVLKSLRKLVWADESYRVIMLPGSGTAAMEAVTSMLKRNDRVLVVSNGVFGDRWENLFKRYPVQVDVIKAKAGEYVREDELEKFSKNNYKLITFTHVETSTGVREPIKDVIKVVRGNAEIIVVDGVSSVGAEEIKMKEWGIDVVITASQKALGCPAGLGLLIISQDAISQVSEDSISGFFLNLKNWIPVMESLEAGKPAYFSTLPVHIIFMLRKSLEFIEKEGIENRIERHKVIAEAIRAGIEAMGLEIVAKERSVRSNTVTAVKLSKVSSSQFLEYSISEGVEFAPGVHPELAGKYFRIGHMGWINYNDAISTVAAIERILTKLGEPIKLGHGVIATQEYLLGRGISQV